ncbi:hypothetical protein Ssi02_35790 [Sinosporangium siamense]|uniref:Uncharacterized protein n=1 Tax=Sinosporangium siamense TaxID=1367973 RepID=A0A919V7D6_9ACTN|nr:hypothetical protein Ssi02_35790 [Sinosporangium siamense]
MQGAFLLTGLLTALIGGLRGFAVDGLSEDIGCTGHLLGDHVSVDPQRDCGICVPEPCRY